MRGPHRHYYFIRELSRRHSITLLTLKRFAIEPAALEEMAAYTKNICAVDLNGATANHAGFKGSRLPFVGNYLKLRAGLKQMKNAFLNLLQQSAFDLILFHGKSVFPVIKDWHELPIVTDFCDATSMRIRAKIRYVSWLQRPLLYLRLLQVRKVEKQLIGKTPHIAFISNRDRRAVLGSDTRAEIVPIGVDLNFWQRTEAACQNNRIVFTGVMDYAPNHDAACYLIEKIAPLIKSKIPELEVYIVGRDPKPALQQLARRMGFVTVTGFVEDLRPYLEKSAVFTAPLRYGSGIQNKVLEALAMELPVVTTSLVAEGLYLDEYGQPPVKQADEPAEFADLTVRLMQKQRERTQLAKASRRFVEKHFNWTTSAKKLEGLCLRALKYKNKNNR
ncbi:MAG: glycosyltransferase [bacterium]